MPVEQQEGMIRNVKEVQFSKFDVVKRLQSGHEPIFGKIEELGGVVERAA